jgi:hypothetical protein
VAKKQSRSCDQNQRSICVDEKLTLFREDASMNPAPVAKMQLWLAKRKFI